VLCLVFVANANGEPTEPIWKFLIAAFNDRREPSRTPCVRVVLVAAHDPQWYSSAKVH